MIRRIILSLALLASCQPVLATDRKPLVIVSGQTKQLPSSDSIIVNDDAYDATTWNGSTQVPTKNAMRDKIEAVVVAAGSGLQPSNNLSDVSSPSSSRTNLGATTVGSSLFTLSNPSAIRFPQLNADNSVSALDASTFLSAIGGGSGGSGSITVSGYTQNTAKILGRTTASSGAIEEIGAGTGITLSGGVISATGGSGSPSDPLLTIHPPTTALFTLSNLGTGVTTTVSATSNLYSIWRTDSSTGAERNGFQGKAVPAGSSWDCTMGFWTPYIDRGSKARIGLALVENSTGKSLKLNYDAEGGAPGIYIFYASNLDTYSSTPYTGFSMPLGRMPLYFRVSYDGTNYIWKISYDYMTTWTTVATLAKASYFTADRVGVMVASANSTNLMHRADVFYYSDPDF